MAEVDRTTLYDQEAQWTSLARIDEVEDAARG